MSFLNVHRTQYKRSPCLLEKEREREADTEMETQRWRDKKDTDVVKG